MTDHDEIPSDFIQVLRGHLERVLRHVQLDSEANARATIDELRALVEAAETRRLRGVAEHARDALAEAWRWRRGEGDDAMDSRIRLARLARQLWRER
jgi:hypothetical protein